MPHSALYDFGDMFKVTNYLLFRLEFYSGPRLVPVCAQQVPHESQLVA